MHRFFSLGLLLLSCCLPTVVMAAEAAPAYTETVFEHNAEPVVPHKFLRIHRVLYAKPVALHSGAPDLSEASTAQLAFAAAWDRLRDERLRQRHFARTAGELGLLLGGGTVWYWANQDFNERDWDLEPTLESLWKEMTGEAVRFDINTIYTNIFNHPFTAAGYYTVARSNGYAFLESFLFTLAGSSVWEYLVEYLELVSLNDQVFSSMGGTVVGEVFYQLGEFFTTSSDTATNRIFKWVFGAGQNYHRWRDGNPARHAESTDRFGFRDDIWHRFDLFMGVGTAANDVVGEIGIETRVIHLPGYGTRAGEVSAFVNGTVLTQMRLRTSFGGDGLQDLSLFMKVMFLGYFYQHLTGTQNGTLNGYSFFVGPASAYEIHQHDWSQTGIEDVYGIVHIMGPSLDLGYYRNALRMRLTMDLYGDFAAIHAFAIDAFKAVGSLEFAKSVLREEAYDYALGLTARTRATLTYEQLEIGASGRYSYYDSIEGLDRFEEAITNDVRTTDEVASVRTWIAYKPYNDVMQVMFSYERRWRSGTASDGTVTASESETEDRFLGSLLFLF